MYWFTLWDRFQNHLLGEWKAIPEEEAKQSRYYGFWGWLLFFYVMAVFGIIGDLLDIFAPEIDEETGLTAFQEQLKYYGGDANLTWAVMLLQDALLLPFLVLAPIKHRLMPKVVIWCMWIGVIFMAATIDRPGNVDAAILNVAGAATGAALFTWYYMGSRRVNVTYLHRIRLTQSKFQQRKEQYRSGRAFTAFTLEDVKSNSLTESYSMAKAKLWRRRIASIALILPLVALVKSLIIIGFGNTLGIPYAKYYFEPYVIILTYFAFIYGNAPFIVLSIIAKKKLIVKSRDLNATKFAIIGSAIALLVLYLPLSVLFPVFFFITVPGDVVDVAEVLSYFWVLSGPLGFIGWYVGRLIWHLWAKRSRKS